MVLPLSDESLEHPVKASTPAAERAAATLIVLFIAFSFRPRTRSLFWSITSRVVDLVKVTGIGVLMTEKYMMCAESRIQQGRLVRPSGTADYRGRPCRRDPFAKLKRVP